MPTSGVSQARPTKAWPGSQPPLLANTALIMTETELVFARELGSAEAAENANERAGAWVGSGHNDLYVRCRGVRKQDEGGGWKNKEDEMMLIVVVWMKGMWMKEWRCG